MDFRIEVGSAAGLILIKVPAATQRSDEATVPGEGPAADPPRRPLVPAAFSLARRARAGQVGAAFLVEAVERLAAPPGWRSGAQDA